MASTLSSQLSEQSAGARERALLDDLAGQLDRAFEQLVLDYQDRLYAFVLRLSGSREEAQEIVQDAFVRAYRALTTYPAERIRTLALRPWLYQIALNLARNRAHRREPPSVSLETVYADPDLEPQGDPEKQPEALSEARERQARLQRLLLALPESYRSAVILRHVEGLSYGEMAAVLEQPVGTIKAHVHRGVKFLREALAAVSLEEERL
jgi:RNA polymerase sigma-70 factor (ECF subfamily)